MRFVRFLYKKDQEFAAAWGLLHEDEIEFIEGNPFAEWKTTGETIKIYKVRYLAPTRPQKIICSGLNYANHAKEMDMKIPPDPVIFLKPPSSIQHPEGDIVMPPDCKELDFEAELAIIIKHRAKNISPEEAKDYILGYTCLNDVTARKYQTPGSQWTRSKGYDTFCPIGPIISCGINPNRLDIKTFLNEEEKQSSNTSEMIINAEKLVSIVSGYMTLNPGDIISTGTPSGVGKMVIGDVVEVVIEKIGTLRNYVTDEEI
ncbi:MAG: fumarylacetoacetate hydrolase family protein [Elusimicrobia bacterium]|nr:fumarylacetoacetate hydrolase family protein [Elusimicrobiota bacterium]